MTIGAYTLAWTALLISASLSGEITMPKKIHQDVFSVVDIQVRTTNAKEAAGAGEIPKLWQKFFQDGIQQKISDRVDGTIYAIYTDYTSDRNGEYSFVIGVRVPPTSTVPAGL